MSSATGAVGAASAGLYAVVTMPAQLAAVPDDAHEKKHHVKAGKEFTNPWDSYRDFVGWQMGLKIWWRSITGQAHKPDKTPAPPLVPILTPTFTPANTSPPTLRATWLGHACFYVEFPSGLRVLFDPVFEDCCTPIALSAFKRYTPPPCEIEDLPRVDLVVISHNHYDHLSYPTTLRIHKKFPNAHFFAPLGLNSWFVKCGIPEGNVTELDWWESRDVRLQAGKEGAREEGKKGDVEAVIGALPSQHVSARGPFDKCRTLWASWSVESGGKKVYFAGDTGYRSTPLSHPPLTEDYTPSLAHLPVCPAFAQIGHLRGPFDLGLLPIGAYEPRWMHSPTHANPKDAVNIFKDTRCRRAVGMHWGAWVLTEEDVMEPPAKLKEACSWGGVPEGHFGVVGVGGVWREGEGEEVVSK